MPSDGDSRAGYEAMGREGWIGLHWPERLGGRGLDPLTTVAAEERFGYHWLPLSGYLLSVKTIGNVLLGHASAELQGAAAPGDRRRAAACSARASPSPRRARTWRRCAPRHGARGIASSCPATRSGPRAPRSRTGSTWRCGPTRTPSAPHRGISVLVADMRSPGIEVREIATVGGGVLCEVFLTDVEVPAGQLVGELHGGWRVLMGTLDHERVTSEKVGVVLRVLDDLEGRGHVRGRPARAAPAARRGAGRAAARAAGRRAAGRGPAGRGPPRRWRSSRSPRWCAAPPRRACECWARARSWRTGREAWATAALAALTRASAGSSVAGGAAEIQRRVIARRGLGCAA